ncbi:hypothetical protein ABB37_00101 [Leptomonas pyrrhocoris]|uniref:Uncharacterized protein n=1 Tax=Leptomonas pyrrhocoris TaxID=157538 RepID=A0A0M9G9T8_LEPPY|nr:hypothetical protein ABB37_00101 [Leptomonas pyrrhocoris]KPA85737.1 hypothetical protein ABB37_00101 [Leptomonas pyrrhocoris]|eukprot:XP_015664176.1 hypothetical protein ABB37_00101 [Leptomonas pyrrhocoris]
MASVVAHDDHKSLPGCGTLNEASLVPSESSSPSPTDASATPRLPVDPGNGKNAFPPLQSFSTDPNTSTVQENKIGLQNAAVNNDSPLTNAPVPPQLRTTTDTAALQPFSPQLTAVPPYRSLAQAAWSHTPPMYDSSFFRAPSSTYVQHDIPLPPALAAPFYPSYSNNSVYHNSFFSAPDGVLHESALNGTFPMLPPPPPPPAFSVVPSPVLHLPDYMYAPMQHDSYYSSSYGEADGDAYDEGRGNGILGQSAVSLAPVLDLPVLQSSPAVSLSRKQEASWRRRCVCVTCTELPRSPSASGSDLESDTLPPTTAAAEGIESIQHDRKTAQHCTDVHETPMWDALVWRWLKQLGMASEMEEILCPGAQRVLVMWSSDQAAAQWRAKIGATALNAPRCVVFENTLLSWS